MTSNPDHIPMLLDVFGSLERGDLGNARSRAQVDWPFDPQVRTTRSMSPVRLMELWVRDGFIDRYTGQRLLYPGALRLLSILMPDDFPYHPNGKLDECHMIHWELYRSHDHIHAAALGGSSEFENLVTCSMLTNARKAHWTLEQLGWSLHEPGSIAEWDGHTGWFVRMVDASPTIIEQNTALRTWYTIAQRQSFVAPST